MTCFPCGRQNNQNKRSSIHRLDAHSSDIRKTLIYNLPPLYHNFLVCIFHGITVPTKDSKRIHKEKYNSGHADSETIRKQNRDSGDEDSTILQWRVKNLKKKKNHKERKK